MEAKIDHASNPAVINSIAAIPKRNAHKSIINGKIIGKEWKRWENIGKSTIHEGFYGNITCSWRLSWENRTTGAKPWDRQSGHGKTKNEWSWGGFLSRGGIPKPAKSLDFFSIETNIVLGIHQFRTPPSDQTLPWVSLAKTSDFWPRNSRVQSANGELSGFPMGSHWHMVFQRLSPWIFSQGISHGFPMESPGLMSPSSEVVDWGTEVILNRGDPDESFHPAKKKTGHGVSMKQTMVFTMGFCWGEFQANPFECVIYLVKRCQNPEVSSICMD